MRPGALCLPRTAFWITDILSDAAAREYVFGRGGSLEFPFPVAVKTGTSQAYHDNWTVGYSKHVTVGVWVGNFDRTPLRNSSGVTGAAPIFHGVMLAAERRVAGDVAARDGERVLEAAAGSVQREICALSGLSANAWCPTRRSEWTAPERPLLPCSWHHLSDEGLLTTWPPEYRAWADSNFRGFRLQPEVPDPRAGNVRLKAEATGAPATASRSVRPQADRPSSVLAIVSPPAGATYLIDPTLRREFQTLPLRAITASRGKIEWSVNGRPVGMADSDTKVEWPLAPGRHQITARDDAGRTAATHVVVR